MLLKLQSLYLDIVQMHIDLMQQTHFGCELCKKRKHLLAFCLSANAKQDWE